MNEEQERERVLGRVSEWRDGEGEREKVGREKGREEGKGEWDSLCQRQLVNYHC